MAQNITAVVHASVAYPNSVGQPSLVLDQLNNKPVLCAIIDNCLASQAISQIIIVTSDSAKDDALIQTVETSYPHPQKTITFYRIDAAKDYSFIPKRATLRPVDFPYMWKPWYGLFTIAGFREISAALKIEACMIIEASQCVRLTPDLLSEAALEIEKGVSFYTYTNPYRRMYIARTRMLYDLFDHYKGKIQTELLQKGFQPLLDDIFVFEKEFQDKDYVSSHNARARANFYPVLRTVDLERLQALETLSLNDLQRSFALLHPQLKALSVDYLEIDLTCVDSHTVTPEAIERAITDHSQDGCVVHFTGIKSAASLESLVRYLRHAKECGNLSVWVEIDGCSPSAEMIHDLCSSGLALLILQANDFLDTHESLSRIVEAAHAERDGLPLFVALTFETDPWLNPQQQRMIESFEKRIDRVIIRSKATRPETSPQRSINFAPLQRTVCQQILNSAFICRTGTIALCSEDREGQRPLEEFYADRATDDLTCRIIAEQSRDEYEQSFELCRNCNAWYVPTIRSNFRNIQLQRHTEQQSYEIDLKTIDPYVCEEALNRISAECERAFSAISSVEPYVIAAARSKKEKSLLTFISVIVQELQVVRSNCTVIRESFVRLFIPVGEAYISEEKYEDALRVWENVLRTDPSNDYIHRRLDELLAAHTEA